MHVLASSCILVIESELLLNRDESLTCNSDYQSQECAKNGL